jgi:hypothetical protein
MNQPLGANPSQRWIVIIEGANRYYRNPAIH